jgi:hypothetical protein
MGTKLHQDRRTKFVTSLHSKVVIVNMNVHFKIAAEDFKYFTTKNQCLT